MIVTGPSLWIETFMYAWNLPVGTASRVSLNSSTVRSNMPSACSGPAGVTDVTTLKKRMQRTAKTGREGCMTVCVVKTDWTDIPRRCPLSPNYRQPGDLGVLRGVVPWLLGGSEDPWLAVPVFRRVWLCNYLLSLPLYIPQLEKCRLLT